MFHFLSFNEVNTVRQEHWITEAVSKDWTIILAAKAANTFYKQNDGSNREIITVLMVLDEEVTRVNGIIYASSAGIGEREIASNAP